MEQVPTTYLMRWNPVVSDFTLDDYRHFCKSRRLGLQWAIFDWEAAHEGDFFVMLREGDGVNNGIIASGVFVCEPFEGSNWRGGKHLVHYIKMVSHDAVSPDDKPILATEVLEREIPEINWRKGHCGELLTPEQVSKLLAIWPMDKDDSSSDESDYHAENISIIDECPERLLSEILEKSGELKPVGEAEGVLILKLGNSKSALSIQAIAGYDMERGEYGIVDFLPVVNNRNSSCCLKITDVLISNNGSEAIVRALYGDVSIDFYAVDYVLNKSKYQRGETLEVALSALAYGMEIVEGGLSVIDIPDSVAKELNMKTGDDDDGVKIYIDEMVALIPLDDHRSARFEFQSPVMSQVRHISFMKREFYKFDICLIPREEESKEDVESLPELIVPLVVKAGAVESKPGKYTPVRGVLWLQGALC